MAFIRAVEKKWWVLLSVGTGSFVTALGTSVINTILPVIQKEFDSDVATIEWVITIYLLVNSGLLLVFGRIGDLFGHKKVFLSGFSILVVSSIFCGFSHEPVSLIIYRGVQAIGGAMLLLGRTAMQRPAFRFFYTLRLLFPTLQCEQSACKFSNVVLPPLENGTIWSTCSSQPSSVAGLRPQRRQRNRSRLNTLNRRPMLGSRLSSGGIFFCVGLTTRGRAIVGFAGCVLLWPAAPVVGLSVGLARSAGLEGACSELSV